MKTLLKKSALSKVFIYLLICPILLLSISCATTGERVRKVGKSEGISLSESNRAKISRLAIMVRTDKDFRYSVAIEEEYISSTAGKIAVELMDPMGSASWNPFGLALMVLPVVALSYLIEHGVRSHIDDTHENELEQVLGDYSLEDDLRNDLEQQIELADLFDVTKVGYDGVLEVTVREWGVNPCIATYKFYKYQKCEKVRGPAGSAMECEFSTSRNVPLTDLAPNQKLIKEDLKYAQSTELNQVGLYTHAKIAQLNGVTLWERETYQLDTACHSIEEFRSNDGLLREAMIRTTDALSGRIVEGIRSAENRRN